MIRVTLDLISANGAEHNARIGEIDIANDGLNLLRPTFGNYTGVLKKTGAFSRKPGTPWRNGVVLNFARQKFGPYDLLYLMLENALGPKRIAELKSLQRSAAEKLAEASPSVENDHQCQDGGCRYGS